MASIVENMPRRKNRLFGQDILANAVSKAPALDALFPGLAQRPAQQARGKGVDGGMGVQGFLGI